LPAVEEVQSIFDHRFLVGGILEEEQLSRALYVL
jgi:hypothetical protein